MFRRRHWIIALFLLALPAVVQAQFTFTTNNGAITIIGYTGTGGAVAIPSTTNGYSVTGIVEFAFAYCTNLTGIAVPSTITSIGEEAFLSCANLTNITVDGSNPSFTSVNGVLFDKGKDTLIDYPEGLTNNTYTVPTNPYGDPASVSIADYAFAYCSSLTHMALNVNSIGEFAFSGCTGLTSVTMTNVYTQGGDLVFVGITNIGAGAFFQCTSLTNVVVPVTNSLNSIGGLAFAFCTNLTSAYLIGDAPPDDGTAFYGDPDATVYYTIGTTGWNATFGGAPTAGVTPAADFNYETFDGSVTITGYHGPRGTVAIPSTINGYPVTTIQSIDAQYVTNIIIPSSITNFEVNAFQNCFNLTSVTFANGTTSIAAGACADCSHLTSINIPPSVTSIGSDAFAVCSSLTNLTIPPSVTSIGDSAFALCYHLISVAIPNGVTNIGQSSFAACGLTNIVIPNSVTSIGQAAFQYDSSLASAAIPDSVTNIAEGTFQNCTSLGNIVIPDSITSIGVDAFNGCASFTSIAIPNSVTNIAVGSFANCTSLTNFSVAAGNPAYASTNGILFDNAYDTLVFYPMGLTSSTYTIPNSVATIGGNAFEGCSNVTSVTIPNSVTSIVDEAFYNCTGLTSIIIPAGVTNIGNSAFQGCSSLTPAYFEGNAPPDLGNAFSSDPNTVVYYLPGTTGWGATFGGAPTELWLPQASAFSTAGQQFNFEITGPTNAVIVVETCTNLASPVWLPVSTNTLSGNNGTSSFSDSQWTNYPNRYYRFSAP